MVLPDPDVVGRPEVGHVGDGSLAVDLPHHLQLVINISAALMPQVYSVNVKD